MKRHPKTVIPAFALSSLSLALLSTPAQAITFGSGDFRGAFNSTLSLGAGWRMEGRDGDLVSPGNTGRPSNEGASASVTDDGNLNFNQGDMYTLVFKGLHDLDLSYKNTGVFTRFKYWYDYELEKGNQHHGNSINGYIPGEPLGDDGMSDLASFKGIELLDAYIYTSFNAGSVPIDLRIGRQVVNWGESTFIQNGINAINPIDVSALRRPGAELKEALLPVGMFYGSFGLTNDLTLEAFYQFEWSRTEIEGCGTYFSTADPGPEGCDRLTVLNSLTDQEMLGMVNVAGFDISGALKRADDVEARDDGQYGVSLKYFAENLGGTEFGLYYLNYHSRIPMLSGVNGSTTGALPLLFSEDSPQYTLAFPEDIHLYGLSFNTNIGGWSLGGELSYRPNMPLDINTTQTLQAIAFGTAATWGTQVDRAQDAGPYGLVEGWDDVEFTQLQFTTIKSWYNVMGAGQFSIVAEVGGNYIGGMDKNQYYGRSPTYGIGDFGTLPDGASCNNGPLLNPNNVAKNCTDNGFITEFAWGYRARAVWFYSNVFAGINLQPQISWSEDVEGVSPAPNFNEGSKQLGFSLGADYLSRYSFDIAYNMFIGGRYNPLKDRDFLSMSVAVSF